MTILQKAKQIAENGFNQSSFEKFINTTKKDVVDYITIFGMFGISQDTVWNAYEEWQTKNNHIIPSFYARLSSNLPVWIITTKYAMTIFPKKYSKNCLLFG